MSYESYKKLYDLSNRKEVSDLKKPGLILLIIIFALFLLIRILIGFNPALNLLSKMVFMLMSVISILIVIIVNQPPINFNDDGIIIHKTYITGDFISLNLISYFQLNDKFKVITIKTIMKEDINIKLTFNGYWGLFNELTAYSNKFKIPIERDILK